jgi:hypothetical protein
MKAMLAKHGAIMRQIFRFVLLQAWPGLRRPIFLTTIARIQRWTAGMRLIKL